jgi:superfamily II DNA or RNA helicase
VGRAHLNRFQDLSEAWLDRIAKLSGRNSAIVRHYLDEREKYGPTIIFAINVTHAALLAHELRDQGVLAEYVASYRPDGSKPEDPILAFRQRKLEVLVNVGMLTEGLDVPHANAVFLARPTASEILLRQMVGRALRGPAMGGTEQAYLVAFEDHWEQFTDWMAPFDLMVPDIVELAVTPADEKPPRQVQDALPWDLIRTVATQLRTIGIDRYRGRSVRAATPR